MKNPFLKVMVSSWLAIYVAGCESGSHEKLSAPLVSDTLKVPPTDTLAVAATAKGVQIYECRANKDNADQYEWVLKAPEADLFDARGKKIGRHYGGPAWESSDGSKVVGELKASEPSPDSNAIPWLLLNAKTHEGRGIFSRVNSINGLRPAEGRPLREVVIGRPWARNYKSLTQPHIISTSVQATRTGLSDYWTQ
jgi:hypothetical protein